MKGEKTMTTTNIFEYATRNKVRFSYKGLISVEDLWDLSVTELDNIYKELNKRVKQSQEESLLAVKTEVDEKLEAMIAIVKHIVTVKLAEQDAREKAAAKKEQKQKIMAIMAKKQDESLENASMEDLQKMLDALDE